MVKGRHIWGFLLLMMLSSAGILSCGKASVGGSQAGDSAPVQLALHMNARVGTKADVTAITEMNTTGGASFRGIDGIVLIPFAKAGTTPASILGADAPLSHPLALPGFTASFHLYNSYKELPLKTNCVLAYGKAVEASSPTASDKQVNGSLSRVGFSGMAGAASQLYFQPDAILSSSETYPAAQTLASILSAIVIGKQYTATASYLNAKNQTVSKEVTLRWNEHIGDANLQDCYEQLTQQGKLLPGSRSSVETLLTTLLEALNLESVDTDPFEFEADGQIHSATNLAKKDMYNGLRTVIRNSLTARSELVVTGNSVTFKEMIGEAPGVPDYPENLGLPAGAAALRWTPNGYVIPSQNGGLDGLAPITSFCYPPCLYYWANTSIKTSNLEQEELQQEYMKANSWSDILSQCYTFGTAVTANTKSVALVDHLQFAVGMLKATVKTQKAELLDFQYRTAITPVAADPANNIEATFPLTGIIIGRQYRQHYDFTPDYVSDSQSTQYYLYDSQIAGVSLTSATSGEFSTLALQTPDEQSVYVSLEFQNNSGQLFYGREEGRIMPGSKFYLVGRLDVPPEYDSQNRRRKSDSVFKQDHITTVSFVVPSLENAYNTIPDLGVPQLALGVLAQFNWELSTPTTISLE